jgi:predicted outer membrane repeat protein
MKSNFSDNKKSGLYLENTYFAEITDCLFTNNKGRVMAASSSIMISKSNFSGNKGEHGEYNCSVILIYDGYTIMSDVTITDNNCTGIRALNSILKLENLIILMRNHGQQGGALVLSKSGLLLNQSTQLIIINNTADTYGGGIYIDSPEKT